MPASVSAHAASRRPRYSRLVASPEPGGEPLEAASDLLNVEEAARFLRVKTSWLYDHRAEIPHHKIGGLLRFRRGGLDAYINANAVTPR